MEPFHCTDGYFEKGSLDYKMLYFITLKTVILYFTESLLLYVTLDHKTQYMGTFFGNLIFIT